MRAAAALALLSLAAVAACATPAQTSAHDRSCAVFAEVSSTPSTVAWPQLNTRDEERVQTIAATPLAPTGYVCGNTTYRDTGRGGAVFFDIGLSADQRFASVGMGSTAFGQRCLLRRRDEAWTVAGCTMLYIS